MPVTLSELRKQKGREELSDQLRKELRKEEQEKARSNGADEFALIRKQLPRLLQSNKHDTAVAALESYLKSFPRSTKAYFLLASVYEHAGAYDRALELIDTAMYLEPTSPKIVHKLQVIENKGLGQLKASVEMKVKCYSSNCRFEKWGSATSYELLDAAIREELQKQIAADLSLLSPLSNEVSLTHVPQYYQNLQAQDETRQGNCKRLHKPYRLQDTFPFQCIATESLEAGSLIMSDIPFALAPLLDFDNPKLFPTCFHCLKERPILDQGFACPLFPQSCPFIFCSAECVLRNVNIHLQECRFMTSMVFPLAKETGFTPGFVLLILRALSRAYIERSMRKPEAEEIQFFFRLHGFVADYKSQRSWVWNCISALSRGLCLMLPLPFRCHMGERELSEFIATVHSNAIPLSYGPPSVPIQRGAPTAALGLALCHHVCSLGHSCIPTCTYVYTPDGRVVVRTIVDVPKEGMLTASFLGDLFLPTARRKNIESSWKVIVCSCKRCREVHEGNRHVSGQRCSDCVRGVRNPLQHSILRGILEEQMKEHPRMKPRVQAEIQSEEDNKENRQREEMPSGWWCSVCGLLAPIDSNRCDVLEVQLTEALNEAGTLLASGEALKARKLLEKLNQQYGTLLHSNHYVLYTMNVFLAGLWSNGSGQNLSKALGYIRKAVLSANAVLPFFHVEKVHLYECYADITFRIALQYKAQRRAYWLPGAETATDRETLSTRIEDPLILDSESAFLTPVEAQWLGVINAWMTCGPKSAQWISALQRLRHLIKAKEHQHTPPLLYVPKITDVERVVIAVRRLLKNQGLTTRVSDCTQKYYKRIGSFSLLRK